MIRFLATTTAAAALLIAPAVAQQATPPLTQPEAAIQEPLQAPTEVQPVTPELPAAETDQIAAPQTAEDASQPDATLTAEAETDIEVGAELPTEVAAVVADGDYSTDDLVTAQLAALQARPLPETPASSPDANGASESEPATATSPDTAG